MEPKKDCQKAGSLDLGGASSGATTPNSGEISARSARRWLSWPFGKSHRCNLQLQSSQTRLEVKEDAGIKEVPTQEQVASRCPLKETAASTEPSKEDGDGGLEPNLSRRGRPALLIHKLKKAFVVWARQKIKAKKASNLKSKRRMKKTIKGKRLKTQTCPDSAGVKAKDEISREAAASYIRNAFERFQKLGASPNAAAANALREMAGLAPVLKAKARTSVPQMLLPPVSWGAFEPATCSDDAETEAIEETLNETILDTQSTQLDPETQDANGDEEDTAVTMKRPSPEPAGVPAEDLLPTAQPDEEKKVKPEAKPQKRRSKANAQKPEEAPSSRRTGRQRMPPLEHWKNERCVYERKSGSSVPSLAAVVKCPAEAQKISSVDNGKGKRAKVAESMSTSKRKRKDNMAAEPVAESADGDLTDHDDAGIVNLPMPSIYDIVDKKDKKGKKKSEHIDVPKVARVKGNRSEAAQKESVGKDTPSSRTSKGTGASGDQSSPPRGLMGALEAARMEAARMRGVARPLASVSSSAPSLNNFRGKPSLAAMAAAAAAAVGNGPSPARTAAADAKPAQRRARK